MSALWLLLPGAGVGLGCALFIREMRPAPPDLGAAVGRVTASTTSAPRPRTAPSSASTPDVSERLASLVARVPGVSVPERDLALTGTSRVQFLRSKATVAAMGFLTPLFITAGLFAGGLTPPFAIPFGAALLLAAGLWFVPNQEVKLRAAAARTECRHAVAAYLDLVALQRVGDAGPSEALERAAVVATGWAFRRFQDALDNARTRGVDPWTGLRELAEELGMPELADVADIVELAATEGAAVYGTLRSRAAALRTELLAEDKERSNQDSERLILPGALLLFLMIGFLLAPAMARLMTTA
jgi:hypothetical protein